MTGPILCQQLHVRWAIGFTQGGSSSVKSPDVDARLCGAPF